MLENRRYVLFGTNELNLINFNEVLETGADTVRRSVDGTKTFVKYEGEMPASVAALVTKSQEYTHDEILLILSTSEWATQSQEI